MSKHTPGPWSADYGDFAAYCETGAEVCEVKRGNHDDGTRIADAEMEANLRLVAAAPDLLDAVEQLLIYLGDWEDMDNDTCRLALTAVAKAKGETK